MIGGFLDDVFIVVVTQASAQLLVVHGWLAFPFPPASGYLGGVDNLELPVALICPLYAGLALAICEELQEKLPQLDLGARAELHLRGGGSCRGRKGGREGGQVFMKVVVQTDKQTETDSPGAGFSALMALGVGDHMSLSDTRGCVREVVTEVPAADRGTEDTGN